MNKVFTFIFFVFIALSVYSQDTTISKIDTISKVDTISKMDTLANKDTIKTKKKPKYWTIKNNLILNFEQSQISNWATGGYSNFAFGAMFKGYYNFKYKKHKVDNTIELSYGRTRQDISGEGIWDKSNEWVKSDDKIELNSIYGYEAVGKWNYSGLMNIKTQFDDGFDKNKVLVSTTLSPTIITTSIGMEYKRTNFSVLFSVVTGKTTYSYSDEQSVKQSIFGSDWQKDWLFSVGSYIKIFYQRDIIKNVNLLGKLDVFWDYSKPLLDTDISGEVFINMKVNKYISTFFSFQAAIDKDFNTKLQYKERFGISIPLNF